MARTSSIEKNLGKNFQFDISLVLWNDISFFYEIIMMSSTKVIEKLKQGIQSLDKCSEAKPGDSMEEEPLSYFIDYLTPAMIEEARTQLKETDEIRPKALEDLRELLKNERNLVTPTDDTFLLSFLRARKFNVKKSFKLLQNYWAFRKEHRHIYDSSDSASVKRLILKPIMGALTYRDRNGCVVLIFKHHGVGVFFLVWPVSQFLEKGALRCMKTFWTMPLTQFYAKISGETLFLFKQPKCFHHPLRLSQTGFDEMGVQNLDWPFQSPNLNHIVYLWGELKGRLRNQPN
ncbi:alpha-tocopherol transfer protein-like protein [Trichonephila clavipes]|nr:alpha-tocopherol transfer protein-like protein [Trichonephila clavipes]